MKALLLISTTVERKDDAERIAGLLLERKLIACAQITGPISSIYRWQGKITTASEFVLSVKTTPQLYKDIEAAIIKEHPYKLPEIIGQEIVVGSQDYSTWVYQEVLK